MKWFQVESNTPNDPKIRRVLREFGNPGFGALVRLWCFVAEHGADVGMAVDGTGRPYDLHELSDAAGAKKESIERLLAVCAEIGHIDATLWSQRRIVSFPAMAKRGDEYTRKLERNPDLHLDKRAYPGGPRRREVFEACDWRCQYCGKHSPDGSDLEVDHRIPKAAGGLNERGNLTTSCRSCNRKKGDRPVPELFVGLSNEKSGAATVESGPMSNRSAYSTRDHNTAQNTTAQDSTEREGDRPSRAELESWFTDQFWPAYPHKGAKQDALKALGQITPTRHDLAAILDGIGVWKRSVKWTKVGPSGHAGEFIELPATFLRGRRFLETPHVMADAPKTVPPPPPGRTGAAPAGKYGSVMRRDEVH